MDHKLIAANFAYGTGPYLRTVDLAIAFNEELQKVGRARMKILVPWVYGEHQKRVMKEAFGAHDEKYPGEILLDAKLGALLNSVFYVGSRSYETALRQWVHTYQEVSRGAHKHLSGSIAAETFGGEKVIVDGKDIAVELNRAPRVRYDVAPAYFTSFAYIAEILERAESVPDIAVDRALLRQGAGVAQWVEDHQRIRCIAYPATFAYLGDAEALRYPAQILVPPIAPLPSANNDAIEPGIFVTITGIPGLERMYGDARRLGLKLYSNEPEAVPGSIRALPRIIPNKRISLQFARAGWSSIWMSMISGTPLVVPAFDAHDDPEIYFNNRSVEELGLGVVYRGQPLEEIMEAAPGIRKSYEKICADILRRWGTLDGNQFSARIFAQDFLGQRPS